MFPRQEGDTSALEQRIAALEGAKGEAPQVDALSEKITALESALTSERSAQASSNGGADTPPD